VTDVLTPQRKSLILLVAAATSSLIMLDTNIVAVSLPTIARDLHTGFTGIQWVISAYLITFASLLLPAGSLADLHGRRRIVLIGIATFLVSSAACGLATSALTLEAARAIQGVGGSMLLTSALAIIASTFTGAERVKAYAFWGTCLGVAITLGPIAGGIITGTFGWRWAFLINVPLCAAFLVGARLIVPESRDPHARRLDVAGLVLLTGGLFALISALIDGNAAGWTTAPILARLGTAAVLLTAFIVAEARQTRPMLDLTLVRDRMFIGAAFGTFGYGASAQVMIFFLPIYLQSVLGFAPLVAGFAMMPFAVPMFVAPRLAAWLLPHWSHRHALVLGLAVTCAGNVALAALAGARNYPLVAGAMVVAGIGTGMLNPETAKAMQAQIPAGRAGMASGIGGTVRFVSLLLGVAVLGAVMAHAGFAAVALTAAAIAAIAATGVAICMAPVPFSFLRRSGLATRARTANATRAGRSVDGSLSVPTNPADTSAPGAGRRAAAARPPTTARSPRPW
jgi:EmrB/QacA subfamily drug resistance transporter